jgi:hypothetical protein
VARRLREAAREFVSSVPIRLRKAAREYSIGRNAKSPWLTKHIKRAVALQFPELYDQVIPRNPSWLRPTAVSVYAMIVGVLATSTIILIQWLTLLGRIEPWLVVTLTADDAQSLIDVLITTLATVAGIVLPIVILVVQSLAGRRAEFLMQPLLRRSGFVWAAIFVLANVAILAGLRYLLSAGLISGPPITFVATSFALTVAVIGLLEIIRVVISVPAMVSRKAFDHVLYEEFHLAVAREFTKEVQARIGERLLERVFESSEFKRDVHLYPPHIFQPVPWSKTGIITDVNLMVLQSALGNTNLESHTRYRVKGVHQLHLLGEVQAGTSAFQIVCPADAARRVGAQLLRAIRVRSLRSTGVDVYTLLEHLRDRALAAVREDAGNDLYIALDQYRRVLARSFTLPVFRAESFNDWIRESLGKWNLTFRAALDLRTIGAAAADSGREHLLRQILVALHITMLEGIYFGREEHVGDLQLLAGLYNDLYSYCIDKGYDDRAAIVFDSFARLLNPSTFWEMRTRTAKWQHVIRRRDAYILILRQSAHMLKAAIDNENTAQFEAIYKWLDALVDDLRGVPIGSWDGSIVASLEDASKASAARQVFSAQLVMIEAVEEYATAVTAWRDTILINAWACILLLVDQKKLTVGKAITLLNPTFRMNFSVDRLTELFLQCTSMEFAFGKTLFEPSRDRSNQVAFDPDIKLQIWYVLTLVHALSRTSETPYPSQRDISPHRSDIQQIRRYIDWEWERKWQEMIGIDRSQVAALLKSAEEYVVETIWLYNEVGPDVYNQRGKICL